MLCMYKRETAINQTPISSIGRKDPLPICMHVAYKCNWALCVMLNVSIKKSKDFSKKKPFAVVRMTRNDNPLLGAMFGFNNSYVAVFDISLTVPQKQWEDEEMDINEIFASFKKLVEDNVENFKFYDFSIEKLSNGQCKSVLITSTKQIMSTRRILSLTDEESSFIVSQQNFNAAVLKKRYKMLSEKEAKELFEKRAKASKSKDDDNNENDED